MNKNQKTALTAIILFAALVVAVELLGSLSIESMIFSAVCAVVFSWCWFQIGVMPEDKTDI